MSTFKAHFGGGTNGNIEYESFVFSGGEVSVKLTSYPSLNFLLKTGNRCWVAGNPENANDIMELMLLVDAIRRTVQPIKPEICLVLYYFPYARQDRVMVKGESLAVKVMADLINSLNLDQVIIWDAHSDVTPALLNNGSSTEQRLDWDGDFFWLDYQTLVAPDAGAMKKAQKIAKKYQIHLIHAEKTRDVKTGEITGTKVHNLDIMTPGITHPTFLIVDDICDGGRTFIELAKEIRKTYPKAKIGLYVTHGIFSKGVEVFEGIIDKVYCPNVFRNVKDHPILTRLA